MRAVHYVNNTSADISKEPFRSAFAVAHATATLPDELADLFDIEILKGYNPDGSDRMIINAA